MKVLKIASVVGTACVTILFVIVVIVQVMSADAMAPQIEMESDTIVVSVTDDEQAWLAGITASDAEDGDLTDKIMVETVSNFITEWTREVSVVVFDSDNNFTKVTRTIVYEDYSATRFALSAPLRFVQGASTSSFLNNLSATDCMDGGVTANIVQYTEDGSTINTDVTGTYQITFSVSNSAGAVEKFTATVEVYDSTIESIAPKIVLTDSLIYVAHGQSFDPLEYLQSVTYLDEYYQMTEDGQMLTANDIEALLSQVAAEEAGEAVEPVETTPFNIDSIVVDNPVDTNQPGWYEVAYTLTDSLQNTKVVRLLVCVTE